MYGLRDCLVDRRCCLYETKSLNDLAHTPSKYVFYESLALLFFGLSGTSPMFLYFRFKLMGSNVKLRLNLKKNE
jgi:hypothetical protein